MASHDVLQVTTPAQLRSNPRAPSSEPSLPRRDSLEDADSSLTRKRPRLDRGRSLSPDELVRTFLPSKEKIPSPPTPMAQSSSTPNKVTINIRTPQHLLNGGTASDMEDLLSRRDSHLSEIALLKLNKDEVEPEPAISNGTESPPSSSDPGIEIEILEPEDLDEDSGIQIVGLDNDDNLVFNTLMKFPHSNGICLDGVRLYIEHLDNENLELDAIDHLAGWLDVQHETFKSRPSLWRDLYCDNQIFWDNIAKLFQKLFIRSIAFGERWAWEDTHKFFPHILRSYFLLVNRLLLVDARTMNNIPPEEYSKEFPLASKHIRALNLLFEEKKSIIHLVLVPEYRFDVNELNDGVMTTVAGADMVRHLITYLRLLLDRLPHDMNLGYKLSPPLLLAVNLGIAGCSCRSIPATFPKHLLDIFNRVQKPLYECLDKQKDPLSVDKRKEIVDSLGRILVAIAKLDEVLAEQLFQDIVGPLAPPLMEHYSDLISIIWKIKLMKKYISKGRMDLRIQGIEIMQSELVAFFSAKRSPEPSEMRARLVTPVLQFLADILLEEKITEYIVGVESHPQLISRSFNVVGFLVVTNKFSADQADLVWKTVISSQDPRVVNATLYMLQHIIKTLTQFQEDSYLCKKLLESPLPTMSQEAQAFFQDFLCVIRTRYENNPETPDANLLPLKLCKRLMCDMSPAKEQATPQTSSVYTEASHSLSQLARQTSFEERRLLYTSWVDDLNHKSGTAAATLQAIHSMTKHFHSDLGYLTKELDIILSVMVEFCAFVERRKATSPPSSASRLQEELSPRLNIFFETILLDQSVFEKDETQNFWDHLVGEQAINFAARDIAWRRLADFASKKSSGNAFLDRCHTNFLPLIQPTHFTPNFFQFVQNITKYKMQAEALSSQSSGEPIPGIDLVWRVILTALPGTGEEMAMEFLTNIYLDKFWLLRTGTDSVEASHTLLVDDCLARLQTSHARLRLPDSPEIPAGTDTIEDKKQGSDRPDHAMVFQRTMGFLTMFLNSIRKQPDFFCFSDSEAAEAQKSLPVRGEPIAVKIQVYKSGATHAPMREVVVGDLETRKEFNARLVKLASASGLSSFRVIWGGSNLSLLAKPMELLKDMGAPRGLMMMQEPQLGAINAVEVPPSHHPRTAFEKQILARFDDFYRLMDAEDAMSKAAFDFLNHFAPYAKIGELVQEPSAAFDDLFPPRSIFKMQYSLRCLHGLLRDQQDADSIDPVLMSHGVRLLESFLTTHTFITNGKFSTNNLALASATISCTLAFLKEFPPTDADPFADPELFVENVLSILYHALRLISNTPLACDCYELLLEACLHCRFAWITFCTYEKLEDLHYQMLLQHPNYSLRATVWQVIKVKIDRFSPPPHLTKIAFASFIWKIIMILLPRTRGNPQCSSALFDLAHYLFANNFMDLRPQDIEKCFLEWCPFIQEHQHSEVVGKEEHDYVLRGFAFLIRHCSTLIPGRWRLPIHSELVEEVWTKHLFPPTPSDSHDPAILSGPMPVVEHHTRWELYALVYNLACGDDDTDSVCRLLQLASAPVPHDRFFRTTMVDRTNILRSLSGYVGLRNLGNTCYMNSLLTQLYMNPSFRAFVLGCGPISSTSSSTKLLYETQKLFACMQNSYAKSADASEFTCNIRTLDDDTIDIREQMDVDEFSNTLFMRWEEQMPSVEAKRAFKSFYTGKTVQQIKSKECEHVSERDDTCLAIQCDVQGKTNLFESLQSFVEGDVMEGDNKYKCEPCGKLVDAVKRTCLKDVPDHLMLQLKRFEFDLGTLRRNKINDLFEFPMFIDMSKYTFDHLANLENHVPEDMFDLVGVVVHKGQADHGHYISYIRVRPTPPEGPVWLQFDDADVTRFSPADIPENCYGGFSSGKEGGMLAFQQSPKSFNGYMLFYQRTSTIEDCPWDLSKVSQDAQRVPMPLELERIVALENASLLQTYNLFSSAHQSFIHELKSRLLGLDHTEEGPHSQQRCTIDLVLSHMAYVSYRIKDPPEFEDALAPLRQVCMDCDKCCFLMLRWFATHQLELRNLLLKSTQPKVRNSVRRFIHEAVSQMKQSGRSELYGLDETQEDPFTAEQGEGILPALLATLVHLAQDELHHNARAWEDFFGLLADIAHLGPQERLIMIQQGLFTVALELFMININRELHHKYIRVVELFRRKMPLHNQLIELVALLLGQIDLGQVIQNMDAQFRSEEYDVETGLLPLTQHEEDILIDWNAEEHNLIWLSIVFDKWDASREGTGCTGFYLGDIVRYLLRGQNPMLRRLITTFKANIGTLESGFAEPYLRAACHFCQYAPKQDLVRELVHYMNGISEAANPTNENDGFSGYWCLQFYQSLHEIQCGNLNENIQGSHFFHELLIEGVHKWAPSLLTFERNYTIGQDTYKLLKMTLLKNPVDLPLTPFYKLRAVAIRKLFHGCTRRARYLLENYPSKSMLTPIMNTMNDCQAYFQFFADPDDELDEQLKEDGDAELIDQYDVYDGAYKALPAQQDDDLAQSSELAMNWEEMDAADDVLGEASDLTEMSDEELLS